MEISFLKKSFGWILIIIGIIIGFVGFVGIMLYLDPNNQNPVPFGLILMVAGGVLLSIMGGYSNYDLKKQKPIFEGEKKLENDSYQLFLVEKYNIKKNETLEKYTLNGQLYKNLSEALETAHKEELNIKDFRK